ncbi:hypothetical protein [Clostridium tarantellae]|uniref:hypothetical protein n=1 Tax=Clostridium tarantellae TaxID=39493 RepID=UPI0014793371|nr:hypothetical protein [Clostridium tarantellae]
MKKLTKSQKLNIFSSACFLFISILDFIKNNNLFGFIYLTLACTFISLTFSEKKNK